MTVMGEPACTEEEDGQGRDGGGGEGASESCGQRLHGAYHPAGGRCGQWIGEEKAAVRAEQMSHAGGSATRGEDRKSKCAFGEVENHCGEAGDGTERHAHQNDGEVLEGERDGRERQWERDVGADGN